MKDIVVIGAGKIGGAIADMLVATGDYRVTIADRSEGQLAAVSRHPAIETRVVDISDEGGLDAVLSGAFAVLSAAPFHLTGQVARSAFRTGTHYLDLTEDVATTKQVEQLAAVPPPPSFPNAALHPASSRSLPMIWQSVSTVSTVCACASAPCRNFRLMRSITT